MTDDDEFGRSAEQRLRMIRDYMDDALRNLNTAMSRVDEALREIKSKRRT